MPGAEKYFATEMRNRMGQISFSRYKGERGLP